MRVTPSNFNKLGYESDLTSPFFKPGNTGFFFCFFFIETWLPIQVEFIAWLPIEWKDLITESVYFRDLPSWLQMFERLTLHAKAFTCMSIIYLKFFSRTIVSKSFLAFFFIIQGANLYFHRYFKSLHCPRWPSNLHRVVTIFFSWPCNSCKGLYILHQRTFQATTSY